MKKIHPKIAKIVIAVMSLLIAGGTALAVKEGWGDPDPGTGGADDTGLE